LIVRAYVGNASNGQLLYHGTATIEYKPSELLKPKAYRYILHLWRGEPVPLVNRETLHLQPELAERIDPQQADGSAGVEPLYTSWYEYHVRAVVRVENLTSTLPASYFRNASGVTYIKIPILILNNPSSQAPQLVAVIGFALSFNSNFRLVWASGQIFSRISDGLLPPVDFNVAGPTLGSHAYVSFSNGVSVCPPRASWIFVWGRFSISFGELFYCSLTPGGGRVCQKVEDRVEAIVADVLTVGRAVRITDVLTVGGVVQGGREFGLLHDSIMDWFYGGTRWRRVLTSFPPLDDGRLDVDENLVLSTSTLYPVLVPCDATILQVPVGAFISVVADAVLPRLSIPLAESAIDAFRSFVGGLGVPIVGGAVAGITNQGGMVCGTDSSVEVYVRESLLYYRFASGCTLRAPLGLFVEARP
ncbi:MAG: hypothetical protein QXO02_01335, partial [Thermofilaceae archaeon]